MWPGPEQDCVTGKVVDKRLQVTLVALVSSGCPDWPLETSFWWDLLSVLIKATGIVIALILQWKLYLPHPLILPPVLFPGLRSSWSPLALCSIPAYPGPVHLLSLFLASSSALWGMKISAIQAYIWKLWSERGAVQWLGSWKRHFSFPWLLCLILTRISFYSYWGSVTLEIAVWHCLLPLVSNLHTDSMNKISCPHGQLFLGPKT